MLLACLSEYERLAHEVGVLLNEFDQRHSIVGHCWSLVMVKDSQPNLYRESAMAAQPSTQPRAASSYTIPRDTAQYEELCAIARRFIRLSGQTQRRKRPQNWIKPEGGVRFATRAGRKFL